MADCKYCGDKVRTYKDGEIEIVAGCCGKDRCWDKYLNDLKQGESFFNPST